MPRLTIHRAGVLEQEIELSAQDLRIGRADQNDIVLEDPSKSVSRAHAQLLYQDGAYVLVDSNSQNGIWIDGQRRKQITLQPGTEVTLGDFSLGFEDDVAQASDFRYPSDETIYVAPKPPPPDFVPSQAPVPDPVQQRGSVPPARMSKAMLFGLFAVVLLVIVVLGKIYGAHTPPLAPSSETAKPGSAGPSSAEEPTGPRPVDARAERVSAAQNRLENNDYDGALRVVAEALSVYPDDQELLDLREKATQGKKQGVIPPPSPSIVSRAPRSNAECLPGESPSDCKARLEKVNNELVAREKHQLELKEWLKNGKNALAGSDFSQALTWFLKIPRDESPEPLGALIDQARGGLRKLAQQEIDDGARSENAGELAAALEHFQKAAQVDTAMAAQAQPAIARVRDAMKKEGTAAFAEARTRESFRQTSQAIALYEKAYRYLPDDDPNKKAAKEKLDMLRGRQ